MTDSEAAKARFDAIFAAGNTTIVTGAALGIGRAMVRDFAGRGMRVVAVDVDTAELETTVELAGGDVLACTVDVSDSATMAALAEEVGPASVLVNNAATRLGMGFDAPLDEWRRAMDINLFGVVNGVQAVLPQMTQGMIINVGSKQGITNPPGHPIYNMAKSALKTYTELLQHHLRSERPEISAHLLVPGWTTTGHRAHQPGAWRPEEVVARMCRDLARGDFYIICPDNDVTEEMDKARILWGAADMTENRPALSRWEDSWRAEAAAQLAKS